MKTKGKTRGRKTLRETLEENAKGLAYLCAMAGKPMPPGSTDLLDAMKPKRSTAGRSDPTKPLEKDVLKAVLHLLRAHPHVAWVARINSGTFMDGDRYVQANSQRGMSDILGMFKGGRLLAVEVKRPGAKLMPHQQEFLDRINAGGGLAFMASDASDVLSILESARGGPAQPLEGTP